MRSSNLLVLLLPVYNDWDSAFRLISEVDLRLGGRRCRVAIINDGSDCHHPEEFPSQLGTVSRVVSINLRRNVGHQAAIAIGLATVSELWPEADVAIMDADGQDRPEDLERLIEEGEKAGDSIILAKRGKRGEGMLFKALYRLFRTMFRLITGRSFRVGNFSYLPNAFLHRIVGVSEIWNSLPCGIYKAKFSTRTVDCDRGSRSEGRSKMSFFALFEHGVNALMVFSERVALRALIGTMILALITFFLIAATVGVKYCTDLAIPGWATTVVGFGVSFLLQLAALSLLFLFMVAQGKSQSRIIPIRDYQHFILDRETLYSNDQ